MIKNLQAVRQNLLRGSAPKLADISFLSQAFGVKKIISLDQETGLFIAPLCKKRKIEQVIIPLNVGDKSSLKYLLNYNVHELIDPAIPTFVHCLHGKDRTGFFIALVRITLDHWSYQEAMDEAKSFGFGIGVDPSMIALYEKLLKHLSPKKDSNQADIVSNTLESNQYRDYTLDALYPLSFAPYGDPDVRKFPYSNVYPYFDDAQYPTRADYGLKGIDMDHEETIPSGDHIPMTGIFDSGVQMTNISGPSLIGGGFV